MTILIENGPAVAGDAARKGRLVVKRPEKITFGEMRPSKDACNTMNGFMEQRQ
jgi:hypothetical protein